MFLAQSYAVLSKKPSKRNGMDVNCRCACLSIDSVLRIVCCGTPTPTYTTIAIALCFAFHLVNKMQMLFSVAVTTSERANGTHSLGVLAFGIARDLALTVCACAHLSSWLLCLQCHFVLGELVLDVLYHMLFIFILCVDSMYYMHSVSCWLLECLVNTGQLDAAVLG